uniref:Peroxiredoxin C-terminal domain-containing protein n=1 Tax=Glossina pallidipes TaxID=7398 RepID=A0A1A9ZQV1_GLOPL
MQLTGRESLATPADWNQGEACMILPTLSNEEASEKYPKGFKTINVPSGKPFEYVLVRNNSLRLNQEYGLLNLNPIASENEIDCDISYHRCESEGEGFYKFFLCDYACFTSAKAENLFEDFFYPTSEEIVNFTPYQAVHCSLTGIQWKSLSKRYKVTKDFLYACPVYKNSIQSNKWSDFPINSYKVLLYEFEMEKDFKGASMFNKALLDNGVAIHDPETRHFLELEIMCDDSGPIEMELNLSNNNNNTITPIKKLLEQLENCEELDVVNAEDFLNEINDLEENEGAGKQSTFNTRKESVECCMPHLENLYKRPQTIWLIYNYNSVDDKSFDEVTPRQCIQNALAATKETLPQEEIDSDNDSELDSFQTYNCVEKDDLDLC